MSAPSHDPDGRKAGSWVIVQRETRSPIRETFDKRIADRIASQDRYEVMTAHAWLVEFNRSIAK
jgi:hypothetical protein